MPVAVWNANALFCSYDESLLRLKVKYVSDLLEKCKVVLIQESHGSLDLIFVYFKRFVSLIRALDLQNVRLTSYPLS